MTTVVPLIVGQYNDDHMNECMTRIFFLFFFGLNSVVFFVRIVNPMCGG